MDGLLELFRAQKVASLLVYIGGDAGKFLERDIADRSDGWAESLAKERTGSSSHRDLLLYFSRLREEADEVYARWPFPKIQLNTLKNDVHTCQAAILEVLKELKD